MPAEHREKGKYKALETLIVCAELEVRIARFYERLAEMFDDDPELSEFWLEMAEEEFDHGEALRSAAETLPLMLPPGWSQEPLIERTVVRKLAHEIQTCERLISQHEGSLDVAFQCSLYIESSELNAIYPWLLEKVPVMWTGTLKTMRENPGHHLLEICKAIHRHSQNPDLRDRARVLEEQYEEHTMG